jgi:hypothetical protein
VLLRQFTVRDCELRDKAFALFANFWIVGKGLSCTIEGKLYISLENGAVAAFAVVGVAVRTHCTF